MPAPTANCPNCGAAIRFEWSRAVQTTCPYCGSVLVRGDVDLKTVGKVGDFPATSSPLQLGATGVVHHHRFTVVGRVVYEYERGSWNAWHVHIDDESGGWLSDAGGEYAFSQEAPSHDIPAADHLHPGANFPWEKRIYKVMAVTTVRYGAAEGELPFTTWDRREATHAMLDANDGHFATIDYRESPPTLYLGEWTSFDALQLDGLREVAGWPRPA